MIAKEEADEAKAKLSAINFLWSSTGLIDSEDMKWLLEHTEKYWTIAPIADSSWARNRTEIFTKDLEIEDLKRQLKEALGN